MKRDFDPDIDQYLRSETLVGQTLHALRSLLDKHELLDDKVVLRTTGRVYNTTADGAIGAAITELSTMSVHAHAIPDPKTKAKAAA